MFIKGRQERKGQRRQSHEEEGEEAERRPEVLDTAIGLLEQRALTAAPIPLHWREKSRGWH